jgi:hypothetical protein
MVVWPRHLRRIAGRECVLQFAIERLILRRLFRRLCFLTPAHACLTGYTISNAQSPDPVPYGLDSLLQMSTGIATAGIHWRRAAKPVPLPVPALDHATGYFMAAAIRAVARRLDEGFGTEARLSLARTAKLRIDGGEPVHRRAS